MRASPLLLLVGFSLGAAAPPSPDPTLSQRIEARLAEAGPGIRFGLVIADATDGRELVAIAPEGRFVPASSTKMFTAAAALATLPGLDRPDAAGGAAVRLEPRGADAPDVVLEGHGDARLSSAADCRVDCLAALADAVAAKVRVVHDVIGDDREFPDERWSPGMSWNNMATRSGTAVSALTLDDNELAMTVVPGRASQPAMVAPPGYFTLDNRAVTVDAGTSALNFERLPGSRTVRLTGWVTVGSKPEVLHLGVDDPADYAAWRLKTLLEARGVRVTGMVGVRHRPAAPNGDPAGRFPAPAPAAPPLARLTPPPLAEDIRYTLKVSQNLYAELLLRRLGRQSGGGSIAEGLAVVKAMLAKAGLAPAEYDFSDGSGMSSYNRVAPRGTVLLLRWAAAQPWGEAWRDSLPIAGVDGTLAKRFRDTPLAGRLRAKTGTLNASFALAGYMTAASGRPLVFAAFAGDVPEGAEAVKAIDSALILAAAAN
jgi:D-alanyl-D-alanine carboxypeptidase/D-alanyl-D-alanine-endopeptidase (penicillin-binding protein 4)